MFQKLALHSIMTVVSHAIFSKQNLLCRKIHTRNPNVDSRGLLELLDEDRLLGDLGAQRLHLTLLLVEGDLGRVLLGLRDLVLQRQVPLQHGLAHLLLL